MTTAQYLKALKRLGLSPYGKETAKALGYKSVSNLAKLASGKLQPSGTLERLINLMQVVHNNKLASEARQKR